MIQDHPRMCGDKGVIAGALARYAGSPPHVRGQVVYGAVFSSVARITPACAGTSPVRVPSMPRYRDHPRMCGDKRYHDHRALGKIGSPPHVRGQVSPFAM